MRGRIKKYIQYTAALLLSLPALTGLLCVRADAKEIRQNETYIYREDAEYHGWEILEYKGTDESVTVPGEIDGRPVVAIGSTAFLRKRALVKKVILPDSVRVLKEDAFAGSEMSDIVLSKNLEKMERGAFQGCENLREITLPDSLTELPNALFDSSGLKRIVIPKNITRIGGSAFSLSTELEQVAFAAGSRLKTVEMSAFWRCYSLKEIKFPDRLQVIEDLAFEYCRKLEKVTFGKNSKLKVIGTFAFLQCRSLKKLTIPKNVKKIDVGAFKGCKKLKKVIFSGSAPKIESSVFKNIDKKAVFLVSVKYKEKYQKALTQKAGYQKKTMRIRTV